MNHAPETCRGFSLIFFIPARGHLVCNCSRISLLNNLISNGWSAAQIDAADNADTDGDGSTANQEYDASTQPTNALSLFRLENVAAAGVQEVRSLAFQPEVLRAHPGILLQRLGEAHGATSTQETGSSLQLRPHEYVVCHQRRIAAGGDGLDGLSGLLEALEEIPG